MKTLIRIGLAAWLLASFLAHAQTQSGPAPDVGTGKKRAAVCFACHNADGISKIPGTPHLAGQERSYLESALRAYRDGQTRQNPTMIAMAKPLSDRDIANIAAYFNLQTRMDSGQTLLQAAEIAERIRPVANTLLSSSQDGAPVALGSVVPSSTTRTGEAIYSANCVACHGTGAAGAPKLGDKAAWSARIRQGSAVLFQHALQGYNNMPAKGTCQNCSEKELKSAIDYLISRSQ